MTSGEGRPPGWDFFISYTQEDRSWAEWVAWVLEEADHKVLVQAWDFVPGTNWIQSMQEGVAKSDRTIAILSSAYLGSQYGTAEWEAAWAADPAGRNRKLLPIRVQDCGRPGLLGGVVGVDLFNMTEAEAKARLLAMISTALSDRARPTCAPTFPGRAVPHEPRFPGALPAIWKVPPPNPNFAGRGEDLNALKTALADTSVVTVQSLRGMGGVGKSQLAAEFAHNHAADYDLVYWISAGNTATIPDQFSALAVQLNLNPEPNPVALREQVHKRLHDVAGWLLIFDNAGTVAGIRDWIPSDPLPAGVPGHVIVTTRRAGFRALGSVTELDVLDPASSAELLQSRVPDLAEDTARDIAKELGHLPLALEQASAYLEQTSIPPGDYLELLRHGSEEIFGRGEVTGHEGTIATLWNIALDRIAAEAPAAIALLNLCAWLAPEPIPLDLFTIHVDLLPEPLAAAAASPVAFNDAVGTLTDYSLAKRTESGLQLHRLVQWAIRAWHASVSGTLGVSETLGTVFRLLIDDVQGKAADAPEYWPRWTILLPHVLTATGDFDWSPFISTDSGQDDASWLLQRAAAYLDVRARLDEALLLAERAVTITENAHGPDHPAVASRLNSLAIILRDLGRATEAKSLAERTIRIAEATHGPEHPDVASGLNTLAVILHDLRRPADGQPLIERALTWAAPATLEALCCRHD